MTLQVWAVVVLRVPLETGFVLKIENIGNAVTAGGSGGRTIAGGRTVLVQIQIAPVIRPQRHPVLLLG